MNRKIMSRLVIVMSALLLVSGQLFAQEIEMSETQTALYQLGFDIPKQQLDAPDFLIPNLDGESLSLENASGKLILLNLWATWCPPCRAEMPSMEELYSRLGEDRFTIYAVAAPDPPRESEEKIRNYIASEGYSFPVLLDHSYEVNGIYGSGSIPTSWLIDKNGQIIARLKGSIDWMQPEIFQTLEKESRR